MAHSKAAQRRAVSAELCLFLFLFALPQSQLAGHKEPKGARRSQKEPKTAPHRLTSGQSSTVSLQQPVCECDGLEEKERRAFFSLDFACSPKERRVHRERERESQASNSSGQGAEKKI